MIVFRGFLTGNLHVDRGDIVPDPLPADLDSDPLYFSKKLTTVVLQAIIQAFIFHLIGNLCEAVNYPPPTHNR